MSEQSAASPLSQFLHREVGLTPAAIHTDLDGDVLTMRLTRALTPMARIIAHENAGSAVVQGVYDMLLGDCRDRFERLAAEMTGFPVRYSRIAVDEPTEDVIVEFFCGVKEA